MKKNLLFIMNNLNCGGAEKSLVTLLQSIDYSKYNVDLYLFKHEGLFMNKVPEQVNILEQPIEFRYFNMSLKNALVDCLRRKKFGIALGRIFSGVIYKVEKNAFRSDQRVWKYVSIVLGEIKKEYDSAIAYLEMAPIYFLVEKVNAKNKIGWIHTNYTNSGMDKTIDKPYFEKLNYIVTVSSECAKSLQRNFSPIKDKIQIINNIVSPKVINSLAKTKKEIIKNQDHLTVVTVARLCEVKGIDLAIEACEILVTKGIKIIWYVIGEGEYAYYNNLIQLKGLEKHIILMGVKENPYSYMEQADIYVQPSRFEGKSIAIEEAKILQKPIIVTNFRTAKEQIVHNANGLIVKMDPSSISEGVIELLSNSDLRNKFRRALALEDLGNEREIKKFYKLL
ncbi:glycosyltransferase [Rossellomorea vietnamensis]|uniref:glycosyltransferase n=1 Tax=Rossellomorea vietnamensis TaxID=218284 RepID=UPI0009A6835B|nr:glycosyl transferase [Bacillus sp. DSM 27956]PRX75772.1 glycosyltransferase involved in cell wall biosynthesis [Bacillus sp. V-88]WQI94224.1 glycosyltransferase [Rossellomorea vietnamensis]SLK23421.1 Glycosyltransferase involved in cell wall bisynthesis [Bacillus sp. V-88]